MVSILMSGGCREYPPAQFDFFELLTPGSVFFGDRLYRLRMQWDAFFACPLVKGAKSYPERKRFSRARLAVEGHCSNSRSD
jgi:hypothetical protein